MRGHLKQAQSDRLDLSLGPLRSVQCTLQPCHQRTGGDVQQHAELVRQEPVATGAPAAQVQLELLDPVLLVAATTVKGVGVLLRQRLVAGDNVTRIELALSDFGLGDNPILTRPSLSFVLELAELPAAIALEPVFERRVHLDRRRERLEAVVPGQTEHEIQMPALTESDNPSVAEPAVRPQGYRDGGKALAQEPNGTPQECEQTPAGSRVPRSQQRRDQTFLTVLGRNVQKQGKVAVSVVVGVEEFQFLLAMARVRSSVHIEDNARRIGGQLRHDCPGYAESGPDEIAFADSVFQAR